MNTTSNKSIPQDGFAGLKENFSSDALSGFLVFLLAMPLSLGIAKASDFPPIYGIITAIIGGLLVSIFAGSRLTIKGPAAGLIVICASAVADFGGGVIGWKITLGVIVAAGVLQIIFGLLKLGKFMDLVPSSAIHGMLAAIGIIIFSKQIHILMGIDPATLKGLNPIELLFKMHDSFKHADWPVFALGILSLVILFGLPSIPIPWVKKIPAPLVVIIVAILWEMDLDFSHTQPKFILVSIGSLTDAIAWNVDFQGINQYMIFFKYLMLFALIGSIESLLTVKAIDGLDPYRRKSDYNKDLIAVGVGNVISGILGGLPMISEVARSSNNVSNGAKTRWANFFHGFWLLVFLLVASPILEMIPNAALAAMLIAVAYKLAHPTEFRHTLHIGKEQFAVFIVTIIVTLAEDLLLGIVAGIVLELIINAVMGKTSLGNLFKVKASEEADNDTHKINVEGSVTFSNYMHLKKFIKDSPKDKHVVLDLDGVHLADHTAVNSLLDYVKQCERSGRKISVVGLDSKKPLGHAENSARKKV